MIATLLTALSIAGAIPPALTAVNRVIWLDVGTSDSATCELSPARWRCDDLPESPHGIVVMIGDAGLAFECVAACGSGGGPRVRKWGRLLVLSPGGVAPNDLRDIHVAAWKPNRSVFRTAARRLIAAHDPDIEVTPVSGGAFWVAGDAVDADSFISIDGPAVGSMRVPVSAAAEGPPDAPFFVAAAIPFSLSGRVQSAALEDVPGADIQLFAPLGRTDGEPAAALTDEAAPMVLHAEMQSDASGGFTFERLAAGSYLLVATDGTMGRGSARVRSLGEPVVVRLEPPLRARGRVLRRQLPVAGARVRFMPAPDAFMKSTDPGALIAEDAVTDDSGRFALTLPRQVPGTLQAVGQDGTAARVPVAPPARARDIVVGDISLPDRRRLTIRLLATETCAMLAAGPLGTLGLTIVRGTAAGGLHWFELPEAGEWALEAECQGESVEVDPRIVAVPARGPDTTVDVRIVR